MASVHLFIVRIEREAPGFRASARRVDEEAAGHFDQPQTLLEFLVGPPHPVPDDRAEANRGAPTCNDRPERRASR